MPTMVNHFMCVNVGDVYVPEYVRRLYRGIMRHSRDIPRLNIFTDHPKAYRSHWTFSTDEVMSAGVPTGSVPGRWGRMMIFSPHAAEVLPNEPHLYIDIDNVILGDLGPILDQIQGHEFSAHRPFSGSGGLAAGIMGVTPGSDASTAIWDYYWEHKDTYSEVLTQNLYQRALEAAGLYNKVNWVSRKQVASYKYLTMKEPPKWVGTWDEASVLCCHGTPNPPDIISRKLPGWERVKENWS